MSNRAAWIVGAALVWLALLALGPSLFNRPFHTTGEAREAAVVRTMFEGGSKVLPRVDGHRIPSKPPLYHWLALGLGSLRGGVDEISARLPSLVLASAAVGLVAHAGVALSGPVGGALAGLLLLTSVEFIHQARVARVDATLSFFLTCCLVAALQSCSLGPSRGRRAAFAIGTLGATLAKGPVGLILPLLLVALAGLLDGRMAGTAPECGGRFRAARRALLSVGAIDAVLLTLVVAGAWYFSAWTIGGEDFASQHFLKENLLRVFAPERLGTGHRHGPLYLLPKFLLGALPFSLLLPALAWHLARSRPLDVSTRFLLVWCLGILVVFSLSASKRAAYLLPAYPALTLLLANLLVARDPDRVTHRLATAALALLGSIVVAVALIVLLASFDIQLDGRLKELLSAKDRQGLDVLLHNVQAARPGLVVPGSGAAGFGFFALYLIRRGRLAQAAGSLAAALLFVLAGILPPFEQALAASRSHAPFARAAMARVGERQCGLVGEEDHALAFYYVARPLRRFKSMAEAEEAALEFLITDATTGLPAASSWTLLLKSASSGESGNKPLALLQRKALP